MTSSSSSASSVNMPSYNQGTVPSVESSNFPETVKKFTASTQKLANNILQPELTTAPKSSSKERTVHYHNHYHGGYSSWFWPRPIYVITPYDSQYTKDSNERALRWVVGTLATVVGAVAFFAIGSFVKSYRKVEKRLAESHSFRTELAKQLSSDSSDLVYKLDKVATLREKILNRKRVNNIVNLTATVSLAAAGTFSFIGALYAAPALMAGGTLLGLGTGAVMLVRWGMDNTESKQRRDARALLNAVDALPQF
jgi:hypothetical protein